MISSSSYKSFGSPSCSRNSLPFATDPKLPSFDRGRSRAMKPVNSAQAHNYWLWEKDTQHLCPCRHKYACIINIYEKRAKTKLSFSFFLSFLLFLPLSFYDHWTHYTVFKNLQELKTHITQEVTVELLWQIILL